MAYQSYVSRCSNKRMRTSACGPPPSGPPVELVTFNGDLLMTMERAELYEESVADFIEDLEQEMTIVDGARFDDLGVFLQRFSLAIRNEVMQKSDDVLVSDYFKEGEEPIRITLLKKPVEEEEYKERRRLAELEHELGWLEKNDSKLTWPLMV